MTAETLSDESISTLYAGAYHLYRNGKYMESIHMFRMLTLNEPMNKRNWVGLGAAYQMINEYDRAIQSYACAVKLDDADPAPHLYAAECFFVKEDLQHAIEAIDHAEKLADKIHHKTYKARISALRQSWKKEAP